MDLPVPDDVAEWSRDTLRELPTLDENQYIEYKRQLHVGDDDQTPDEWKRKIEREITAFANAYGGILIFGVGDEGNPFGFDPPENELDQSITRFYQNTTPTVEVDISDPIPTFDDDSENVCLAVRVHEATRKPVTTSDSAIMRRINARKEPMSREQIESLFVEHELKQQRIRKLEFEVNRFCRTADKQDMGFGRDRYEPPYKELNTAGLRDALESNTRLYTDRELRTVIDDVLDDILTVERFERDYEKNVKTITSSTTTTDTIFDSVEDLNRQFGENLDEAVNSLIYNLIKMSEIIDLDIDYDMDSRPSV